MIDNSILFRFVKKRNAKYKGDIIKKKIGRKYGKTPIHKRIKEVENRVERSWTRELWPWKGLWERADVIRDTSRFLGLDPSSRSWPPMKTIALSVDSLEQFARPSKLLPGRSAFDLVFLGVRSTVFDGAVLLQRYALSRYESVIKDKVRRRI